MTTRYRLLVVGTGVALFGAVACNNDKLTDINKNPNSPEDVPASSLFTTAAQTAVSRWLGANYSLRATEFVAQHLAEVQYPDEDRYARLTGGSTTGYFDGPYVSDLEDFRKVIQKGLASNSPAIYAPAQIMRTWSFDYITDTWGDIPYFQALRGDSVGGSLAPAYDPQKAIYTDFFAILDGASKALSSPGTDNLGGADPIYAGDPLKWQRFANSLRAELALRLVNVDAATASAQLSAAFAAPGGVFTSNADNAELVWPGDGVYNNPWSDNFKGRDDHRMSNTMMNILIPTNDPRTAVYAQPTIADPTVYAGMPNGLTQATAQPYFNTSSRPGVVFYPGQTVYGFFGGGGPSWPSFLLTYADVSFIKAEAAERGLGGLTSGQAAGFYNAAITASMNQWGINDPAAIATFLAQPAIAYKGGTAGQVQIAVQRWVALFTDGGQAWSEWRRTCQPSTIRPGPAAISTTVPRRFQYSATEYSVNSANLGKAVTTQGADEFQTHMYWDKAPTTAPTYVTGCGQQ